MTLRTPPGFPLRVAYCVPTGRLPVVRMASAKYGLTCGNAGFLLRGASIIPLLLRHLIHRAKYAGVSHGP